MHTAWNVCNLIWNVCNLITPAVRNAPRSQDVIGFLGLSESGAAHPNVWKNLILDKIAELAGSDSPAVRAAVRQEMQLLSQNAATGLLENTGLVYLPAQAPPTVAADAMQCVHRR
jgi:hypothetical protein